MMKKSLSKYELPDSALKYVLESLTPYTKANLKLVFTPSLFFRDLENIDRQKQWRKHTQSNNQESYKISSIKKAYYKARKEQLIQVDEHGVPALTPRGKNSIKPYQPKYLGKKACVIVTFDIPERDRNKRDQFRTLLKMLEFKPIQQSVWKSSYDHRKILTIEIKKLGLSNDVHVYEAVRRM